MENNKGVNTTGTEPTNGTNPATGTEPTKTYTHEEVLALLQSESDKRVSEALKKQQKKYEQKLKNRLNIDRFFNFSSCYLFF